MLTKDNLNETLADAVMDRPREFFIGKRRFCLWSPSLGMSMMLERHISQLGIDNKVLYKNHSVEALRLAKENKQEICYIIAIRSFRLFSDLSNTQKLKSRAEFFSKNLSEDELAQLILLVLSETGIETFLSISGICDEQKEQARIAQIKNKDGHNKSFGGKTIYGLLIDAACKTYGWTKQYVVWGIDLISLRMMLADSINTIYLSDEDMKQCGVVASDKDRIGMTADDFAKLKEEFKD